MTKRLMKASLMLSLPLVFVLATPPSHAGVWRSSEPQAPVKKASATKHVTTTKQVAGSKKPASTKSLAGTKLATSAKPTASAKPAPTTRTAKATKSSATAKGGAQTTQAATTIGSDGQVVYHSISDWQPGSLNRQNVRASSSAESRNRRGESRERAVEVALSSVPQ